MTYEWHIGDPDDWGDGFMDAQNWGRGGRDDETSDNHENKDILHMRNSKSMRPFPAFQRIPTMT